MNGGLERQPHVRLPDALFLLGLALACTQDDPSSRSASPNEVESWFVDVASDVGLEFRHESGRSGERHYIETAVGGGGWIDFDRDGDLDLYLVNGAPTSEHAEPTTNHLWENLGDRFVDSTMRSGLGDSSYGMGLCITDVNADGWPDLYVTNYGPDRLFVHRGDLERTPLYADETQAREIDALGWSTGCASADLDRDGDLDLYVTRYLAYEVGQGPLCGDAARGLTSYCRPDVFRGEHDLLLFNDEGVYSEVSGERGIEQGTDDRGYGVLIIDLDGDAAPEILVANDGTPNRLYRNDGRGSFRDVALEAGFSVNGYGRSEAGMGIAVADIDLDGLFDIFLTHYEQETNTLYRQIRPLEFDDVTNRYGLASISRLAVGWGVELLDWENDGDLDLAIANGHVLDNAEQLGTASTFAQADHWLLREGDSFEEVGGSLIRSPNPPRVGRCLAKGDWNDDGRIDLLICNEGGRPWLFENRSPVEGDWLRVELVGPSVNPLALGATVQVWERDRLLASGLVRSGGSYLSQNDLRLHFGLGPREDPAVSLRVVVTWPDGSRQDVALSELNREMTIVYDSKKNRLR